MPGAEPLESNPQPVADRGAHTSAPRSTPLTMVSAAVAGDDLQGVAGSASDALGCSVAIALPTLGEPVVWPPGSGEAEVLRELVYPDIQKILDLIVEQNLRIAAVVP